MKESRKKEFSLHFGRIGTDTTNANDMETYHFKEFGNEFFGLLLADVTPDKVYLVSFLNEEFVTSDLEMSFIFINSILDRVEANEGWGKDCPDIALHFQEYESFEYAYEVCIMMQEGEEDLCYINK